MGARRTILLVEDNPDDTALTLRAFKKSRLNKNQLKLDPVLDDRPGVSSATDPKCPMPLPDHRRRILLVDDEPSVITAVGLLLQNAGYQVQVAGSGAEAVALLQKNQFDLLITDNHMPEVSGIDLAMVTKECWPTLPIFMFTAYPPSEPLYCIDLVLTKPHDISRLCPAVQQLLLSPLSRAPSPTTPSASSPPPPAAWRPPGI
jgi:CheY-like chemotaxis protein